MVAILRISSYLFLLPIISYADNKVSLEHDLQHATVILSEVQKKCNKDLRPLIFDKIKKQVSNEDLLVAVKYYYILSDLDCSGNALKNFIFYAYLKNNDLGKKKQIRIYSSMMKEFYLVKNDYLSIDSNIRKIIEKEVSFDKPFDLISTINKLK